MAVIAAYKLRTVGIRAAGPGLLDRRGMLKRRLSDLPLLDLEAASAGQAVLAFPVRRSPPRSPSSTNLSANLPIFIPGKMDSGRITSQSRLRRRLFFLCKSHA